jgi:hypothetical protein
VARSDGVCWIAAFLPAYSSSSHFARTPGEEK